MPRTGGLGGARVTPGEVPEPIRSDPHPGFLRGTLHLVYDLAWCLAAAAGTPWLLWRSAREPGFGAMVLERMGRRLPPPPPDGDRARVLVHGVSVGEVKGAIPLVAAIEDSFGGLDVQVSSTTDTGMQVAREEFRERSVVRFPADISFLVRRFLDRVRPDFVVLVELEIWPNFLRECNRRGIPVAVVNGRITSVSHTRYLVFRHLLPQFDRISLICVQGESYAKRFLGLEVDPRRVVLTGSIKADRLRIGPVEPGDELRRLLGGRQGQLVVVAGSTHEPEERHVALAWRDGIPDTRLILVPRHPGRSPEIVRALDGLGIRAQRLTELRAGRETPDPSRPCLVDTIGELERVYGLASVVFVGGTLIPHGGQNILEPAAQGRSVVFGPHVDNFEQEAALLVSRGAGRQIGGPDELLGALRALVADAALRERMGRSGLEAVRSQKGAIAHTLDALSRLCLRSLAAGELAPTT